MEKLGSATKKKELAGISILQKTRPRGPTSCLATGLLVLLKAPNLRLSHSNFRLSAARSRGEKWFMQPGPEASRQ